jgi:hypothetical protein
LSGGTNNGIEHEDEDEDEQEHEHQEEKRSFRFFIQKNPCKKLSGNVDRNCSLKTMDRLSISITARHQGTPCKSGTVAPL